MCTEFLGKKSLKTLDLKTPSKRRITKDYSNKVFITDMDKSGSGPCPIAV